MNNKVINVIQIVIVALSICALLVAVMFFASTEGVPNDAVGALHNVTADMRGLLFIAISGALLAIDVVWLIVRVVLKKKQ